MPLAETLRVADEEEPHPSRFPPPKGMSRLASSQATLPVQDGPWAVGRVTGGSGRLREPGDELAVFGGVDALLQLAEGAREVSL